MNHKQMLTLVLEGIAVVGTFALIILSAVMQFLILKHIHATDVMWLLYWVGLPLSFGLALVGQFCGKLAKEVK